MTVSIESYRTQQGIALVVSLVFLLLLTLIGLATMRATTLQQSMANNIQDQMMAFAAAEAALRAGQREVAQFTAPPEPVAGDPGANEVWELDTIDWAEQSATWWQNHTIQYGTALDGVATRPHYAIEFQASDSACAGHSAGAGHNYGGANSTQGFYRITARGTGLTDDTVVILQSTVVTCFD